MSDSNQSNLAVKNSFLIKRLSSYVNVRIFKNPLFVMFSLVVGIYIGLYHKDLAETLKPFGITYLRLLQMSVIPILITAVISSIGRISDSEYMQGLIPKYILFYVVSSFLVSSVGVVGGLAGGDYAFKVEEDKREELGFFVEQAETGDLEISLSEPFSHEEENLFAKFLIDAVPENIFRSLVSGATVQLVFFAVVVGISLNLLQQKKKKPLIDLCISVFLAFQRFIGILVYFLPFGIICLLSSQIAATGIELIQNMLNFILLFYILAVLLILLAVLLIYFSSKTTVGETYRAIISPIMISFTTRSSFASIPASVDAMEKLRFDRMIVNLLIPLGITIGRYGNILFFAVGAVFTFYLYQPNDVLGMREIFMIISLSIIAGLATTGASGFATLGMLAIILKPLGLPFEAVVLIFTAIDIIIDPIRSLLIVIVNIAVTGMVSKKFYGVRKNIDNNDD